MGLGDKLANVILSAVDAGKGVLNIYDHGLHRAIVTQPDECPDAESGIGCTSGIPLDPCRYRA